jgi:hypothetical protein
VISNNFGGAFVYGYYITGWKAELRNNQFLNNVRSAALYIGDNFYGPTLVEGNSFRGNNCTDPTCYTFYYLGRNHPTAILTMQGNEFIANRATTVNIYLELSQVPTLTSLIAANTFADNQALASNFVNGAATPGTVTVAVYGTRVEFDSNFFQNSLLNTFELAMMTNINATINATDNWWGTTSSVAIAAKIFDQSDLSTRPAVQFEPFLLSASWDCAQRNNCSGHGQCTRSQFCTCDDGYEGLGCEQYSCKSRASNCYGRGDCIGPNICNVSNRGKEM